MDDFVSNMHTRRLYRTPRKHVMNTEILNKQSQGYCGTFYAAKALGLSVATVQTLAERGELEAWKTQGGHRRISLKSIREYMEKNGTKPTSLGLTPNAVRVLVVDDDPTFLTLIRKTSEKWHLPVDFTVMASAIEALLDIHGLRPHVLFTDLRKPALDGYEGIRKLRSNAQFAGLHVVAVTGMTQAEITERGGLPPGVILVQKPLDMHWLQGFVTALVAERCRLSDSSTGEPVAQAPARLD